MPNAKLDPMKIKQTQELLQNASFGAFTVAMTGLGCRLGLYKALAGAGAVTSVELAKRTGLHERWLREWLRSQAASDVLVYEGDGRFRITDETASFLADEDAPTYAGQRLLSLPELFRSLSRLPESFRTGIGYTWDERGREATANTDRARVGWYRRELVPKTLPGVDGLVAKLEAGAEVADVGCGTGWALWNIARAYPRSRFHGYEISEDALDLARENASEAGLTNVTYHQALTDPMPQTPTFDLMLTFDCLHDMTEPRAAAAEIRRAIKDDGTWLIMEIDSMPTYEENLARNRGGAAAGYAVSVLACLASSMAAPGAVGYGTLGLPEPILRELVQSAGFKRFKRLDLPAPVMNALYEARP
ncbi:MAG TPA: class I SAM-dependent methyltransferase [Dehalococcoidia bacterium]|nr:class I SAM-dependent methyltransferase [Dehalococcoidia bacterium]